MRDRCREHGEQIAARQTAAWVAFADEDTLLSQLTATIIEEFA